VLMLSYYRNNLVHVFINEAEVACALLGFSIQKESGFPLDQVWKRVQFLKTLLNEEFVVRDTMKTLDDFKSVVNFMQKRKFLQVEGDRV